MKILGIIAHADDEIIFAGTFRKFIKEGGEGKIICFTGDETRKREFLESCKILGAKGIFLGNPNMGMKDLNFKKELEKLVEYIRKFKPDIITTVSDIDYHPDHKEVVKLVETAVEFASHGTKKTGWLVKKVLMFEDTGIFSHPDYLINIDKEIQDKINAMKTYTSELNVAYKKNYYLNSLKKKSAFRGVRAGCEYAEACKEIKFPIHGNFYCEDRTINSIKKWLKKK